MVGARSLALLYAVYATIFVLLLSVVVPPMQGADEGAHLVRADQISLGEPVAYRLNPQAAGGVIDLGILEAVRRFYPVVIDLAARVSRPMYAPIGWGEAGPWSFPNTALYPPVFYLPAAAAIVAGKRAGLDVLHTAALCRIALGLTSVAVATLAIAFAGPGALWLFALLLLPSSAGLMASVTQDGLILASTALAAALAVRLQRKPVETWRLKLVVLCALLALLGMSRPPYAALALLPLAARTLSAKVRWIAVAAALLPAVLWSLWCAKAIFVSVDPGAAADASAQLHLLLSRPWRIPALMANTMSVFFLSDYAGPFITIFGPPGNMYRPAAACMLGLTAIVTCLRSARLNKREAGVAVLCIVAAVAGIFLIQYLTWTPVGDNVIRGVLGRYFLPLAAFLPLLLGISQPAQSAAPSWLAAPILAFPVVSIIVTLHNVVIRYYI